ncbi:hypothetical protein GCM10009104_25730 [Marinobacterium maritimum]|uniref:Uncharacterized protein n=1 Tax=Marinobacterium maritimum TaxID=500162 RepID=A0ABN1I864_9GAMM
MDWPNHYPSQCPPSQAETAQQTIYRFLTRRNPRARDFLSYYDIDIKKVLDGKQEQPKDWGDDACRARGLSVFTKLEHCYEMQALVPAMRKKPLGELELEPTDGALILKTTGRHPEHHTVWIPSYNGLEGRCVPVPETKVEQA